MFRPTECGLTVETRRPVPGVTVVALQGDLDIYSLPRARQALQDAIDSGEALVLDLDGLDYMDSCGIGLVIRARRALQGRDLDLPLLCSNPRVRRLFRLVRLEEHLCLVTDLDEALARIGSAEPACA